ncbi:MAG: hypothetical protein ACRC68_16225 [Clostridium sp.]
MYKKILVIILIAILVIGNVYFYNKTKKLDRDIKKLDYDISIGTPVGSRSSIERTDFVKPLFDREEASRIIFSLMDGISIDKPKVCEKLPDSTIWFNGLDEGVVYYIVNLWVDENTIIVETNVNAPEANYKKIVGNNAIEIKKIIEKYKITTLN